MPLVRRAGTASRGALVALLLALLGLASADAQPGGAVPAPPPANRWSATRTLAPISQYAFSPALAVNESGQALAAWSSGPPPVIYADNGAQAPPSPWHGVKVLADVGSTRAGFRRPVLLAGRDNDTPGNVQTAVSGSGVGYVAWLATPGPKWMITTERAGRFIPSRPLRLPGGGQFLQLASARNGPVDVVWLRFGLATSPELKYARLEPDGRVGQPVTVAVLGWPVSDIDFAMADSGAAVASWVLGPNGMDPRRPHAVPHVRAVLCSLRDRCGRAQTLSLGPSRPQYVDTATTLSDDGTATVLAGGEQETLPRGSVVPVETGPHGLWGSVSHHGRPFRPTPEISATGDGPVAASAGRGGAIALFNVGTPPIDTIAHSTLAGTGARFGPATDLPDHETIDSPLLAADLAGAFVVAWFDNDRKTNAADSLHATVGTASGALAPPRAVASTAGQPQEAVVGIDGHGNAILLWDSWRGSYTHGVFAAFHRS